MPTTSNFGWTTPADTDLVKDGAAAIRTLGNGIDTSFVDLKGGTTGQVLSKNTNTDLDFTWVTPNDADAIQNSIMDAKGDLISASAADTPARLASSGVNGDVLTVDTSTATGLKWATPASGGYTLLSTTTLSGSSVSVTSISGSYVDLLFYVENAGIQTTAGIITANFNSLTANNLVTSFKSNSTTALNTANGNLPLSYGETCDTGQAVNSFAIHLRQYATGGRKPVMFSGTYYKNGYLGIWGGGAFETGSAVTSFQLTTSAGTFSGGTLKIYGVK